MRTWLCLNECWFSRSSVGAVASERAGHGQAASAWSQESVLRGARRADQDWREARHATQTTHPWTHLHLPHSPGASVHVHFYESMRFISIIFYCRMKRGTFKSMESFYRFLKKCRVSSNTGIYFTKYILSLPLCCNTLLHTDIMIVFQTSVTNR